MCVRGDKKGGIYAVHHHFILNYVSENQSQDTESLHADGAAFIHYSLTIIYLARPKLHLPATV